MIDLVRVFGRKNPNVNGMRGTWTNFEENKALFLNPACIKAIYPFWGVSKDRRYYECAPSFEGAEIPFCWVEDFEGNKFILLRPEWPAVLAQDQIEQMTGKKEQKLPFGFASHSAAGEENEKDLVPAKG
jgi:hypothetical protein